MSILAIMTADEAVPSLCLWAKRMAEGRGQPLILLAVRPFLLPAKGATPPKDKPVDLSLEHEDALVEEVRQSVKDFEVLPTLIHAQSPDFVATILAAVDEHKASLLLIGKEEVNKPREGGTTWRQALFQTAPCDTIIMRPGAESGKRCNAVLVPVAGGPHAPVALKLAESMMTEDISRVTALFVEPDIGELASDLGHRIIDRAMRAAGIKGSERVVNRVEIADQPFDGITQAASEGYDLVLLGASESGPIKRILFGTVPQRLMDRKEGTTVAIIRRAIPLSTRARAAIEEWVGSRVPQLSRDDRLDLFERLQEGSDGNFDFYAMTGMATAIASLGLIQNSGAVVIGAMLVAPLMTPMVGSGLALVQGNNRLAKDATMSIIWGFLCALAIGFFFGCVTRPEALTDQLLARGKPGVLDVLVAVLSGMAAAYAQARPNLSSALPGVAIAAALVPPIATCGISASMGEWSNAEGAVALFVTNLVLIVLGSAASLYVIGIRGNDGRKDANVWVRHSLLALTLAAMALSLALWYRVYAH